MERINKQQLFFSHTWQNDNLNRDNHKRVYELSQKLKEIGWSIWIDEDNIIGNIDAAMVNGIDGADVIIVCLTEEYCRKINKTANNPRERDNCLKEWTYANIRKKLMVPIIMESSLLNQMNWPPGIVSLYFGSTFYINASDNNLNDAVNNINKLLLKYKIQQYNENKNDIKKNNYIKNNIQKVKNLLYLFKETSKKIEQIEKIKNRRETDPIISNRKLKLIHNRWKSTGQLKEIYI